MMNREEVLALLAECGLIGAIKGLPGRVRPRDRAADIIADLDPHDRQSNEIIAALERAGLEIVDKVA